MELPSSTGLGGRNQVGQASLVTSPLDWRNVLPGSHQVVVWSPSYELRQPDFQRKLARAIDEFAATRLAVVLGVDPPPLEAPV